MHIETFLKLCRCQGQQGNNFRIPGQLFPTLNLILTLTIECLIMWPSILKLYPNNSIGGLQFQLKLTVFYLELTMTRCTYHAIETDANYITRHFLICALHST
jgi:hypothetical protein